MAPRQADEATNHAACFETTIYITIPGIIISPMNNQESLGQSPAKSGHAGYSILKSAILILLTSVSSISLPAAVQYQVAAKEGNVAPGGGGVFTGFDSYPAINHQGKVIFVGDVGNTEGIWVGAPGSLALVALEGQPVPGIAGATYSHFSDDENGLLIASDGAVGFGVLLAGPGITSTNHTAIMVGQPGSLAVAYQMGTPVPGRLGETFVEPGGAKFSTRLHLRAGNLIGFRGRTSNSASQYGLWAGTPGNILMIVGAGQATPYGTVADQQMRDYALAPDGSIFVALGRGGSNGGLTDLWRFAAGGLAERLFRQDGPAPEGFDFDSNLTQARFTDVRFYAPSTLKFRGRIIDGLEAKEVAVVQDGATPSLLIVGGRPGPAGSGIVQYNLETHFNASEAAASLVNLTNGMRALLYGPPGVSPGSSSSGRTVFRQGDPAPGQGSATFGLMFGDSFCMNSGGLVAFHNSLSNATSTNDATIWVWDPAIGVPMLVAREGSPMDFGDGVVRTPTTLTFRGGEGPSGGRTSAMNDSNQIVFELIDQNFVEMIVVATYSSGPVTFAAWAASQGLTGDDALPGADPNLDGIPNIAAYFLGLPALGTTSGSGLGVTASGNTLLVRFSSPDSVSGVTVGPQVRTSLAVGLWVTGPVPAIVGTNGSSKLYEVAFPIDVATKFGRLTFAN